MPIIGFNVAISQGYFPALCKVLRASVQPTLSTLKAAIPSELHNDAIPI